MKLALVTHPSRELAADIGGRVAAAAARLGMTVTADPEDVDRVEGVVGRDPGPIEADVIVAAGGDGTVLEAVRRGLADGIPVLGVNAGHVGFLAEVEPHRIDDAMAALHSGSYEVSSRMTVEATLPDGSSTVGLNDVVVEKSISQHVVRIAISVGSERLVEYRTDAVIVASPTGSTAYTFSAGGPLVDPELEALVVTAVAPHNLFGRPLVFRPSVELELGVTGDRSARVNVDGRHVADLDPGMAVTVRQGPSPAHLVRLWPRAFTTAVTEKFGLDDA